MMKRTWLASRQLEDDVEDVIEFLADDLDEARWICLVEGLTLEGELGIAGDSGFASLRLLFSEPPITIH